jgi:hypothetical protein
MRWYDLIVPVLLLLLFYGGRRPLWLRPAPKSFSLDAAKPRELQFSIRRMLCAMTLLCVAAWAFSVLARHVYDSDSNLLSPWCLSLVGFSSAGAGIGAIIGSAFKGAKVGLFCLLVLLISLLFLTVVRF